MTQHPITLPTLESLRSVAFEAGNLGHRFIRARFTRDCAFCGAANAMTQDAAIATGLPLEYHTPEPGEVLKNHYMACSACGADQAS